MSFLKEKLMRWGKHSDVAESSESSKDLKQFETYSSFTGYCVGINYIIGVGLLAIPNAFRSAGILFSSLMLFMGTCIMCLTSLWILEGMCRVQALDILSDPSSTYDKDSPDLFKMEHKKYEMNEILDRLLGPVSDKVFSIVVSTLIYLALWCFSVVFGSSLLALVPLPGVNVGETCDIGAGISSSCRAAYLVYELLLLLIVLPLSCKDLVEQKILQMFLTAFRFLAIFLMVSTSLFAMARTPYDPVVQTPPPYVSYNKLAVLGGFPVIFATSIFSQMIHSSVPGLVQPVKDKRGLRSMFVFTYITTFSLYCVLGISTSMYFGKDTNPIVSINWVTYSGSGFLGSQYAPLWARFVAIVVLMFPVLDVISAYPLNSVVLANVLYSTIPSRWSDNCRSLKVKVITRFLVAIPPILLGMAYTNFEKIVNIAGSESFIVALIAPSVILFFSIRKCRKDIGRYKTPYDTFLSHPITSVAVAIFGVAAFFYVIIDMIVVMVKG